jgi:hypothetical protein
LEELDLITIGAREGLQFRIGAEPIGVRWALRYRQFDHRLWTNPI